MTAHDDLIELTGLIEQLNNRCINEGPAFLTRASNYPATRDGFPRTASGADRSSPGSAPEMPQAGTRQAETGLWGFECSCGHVSRLIYPTQLSARAVAESHLDSHAGSTLDYGDPTGDAAVARPQSDPVRARARAFRKHLDAAVRYMTNAAACLDAEKVDRDKATPAGDEDRWCQSCARDHGYREPIWAGYSSSRCRWCYEFSRAHHQDPPLSLLANVIHAGKRCYDADIKKALAAEKGRKAG